jgi:PAS domain S-box-containing protein
MIHIAALEQLMHTLTQEAGASLTSATPLNEAQRSNRTTFVMFLDNTGRYVGANASAAELTGYSRRELLMASIFDITPPIDEREVEILWRAFLRTGRQDGEVTLRRRDGSQVVSRYLATTNVVPGVHVSVLAKI